MNKILSKTTEFDPKKCIPQSWRIPSSGYYFYRFGFSQYRNVCTDRPKLYHPLLVFILPFIYTLRCIYSTVTPPKPPDFHLLIGDWGHFIDMQFHMNLTLMFGISIGFLSKISHYYEYVCCRGQPYMNIFNMMSGKITPHSIGLTNAKIIKAILKRIRICFKIYDTSRVANIIAAIISFFFSQLRHFTKNNLLWIASFSEFYLG